MWYNIRARENHTIYCVDVSGKNTRYSVSDITKKVVKKTGTKEDTE